MATEPTWDAILGTPSETETPLPSRRAQRAKKTRRRVPWGWLSAMFVVLAVIVGGGVTGWLMFEKQIRDVLGIAAPTDYNSTGNGEEITIVIEPGDIGANVADKLYQAGVTLSFEAFYTLLLGMPEVTFEPGNYRLQLEMSAASALAALQDPSNRIQEQVIIPEGVTASTALELIAAGTSIPLEQLQAAAADYPRFGVPASVPSIEGFLFPATYTFNPGTSADQAIQMLADEMTKRLDALGVAQEERFRVLTLASIVQREAGNEADMAKVARVFDNRLARGMHLESDATVSYGTGNTHTVWTTPEERADPANLYNTYANPGLPVGPIGLPGEAAIAAAQNPDQGEWLYFVAVNLYTGETVFSNTLTEHNQAAQQLYDWCRLAENAAVCE